MSSPHRPRTALVAVLGLVGAPALGAALAPAAWAAQASAHVVREGDTLGHIALRHGTTVTALVTANGIARPALITVGQRIELPPAAVAPTPSGEASGSAAPAGAPTAVVREGDTLGHIAVRAGVSLGALYASSGLDGGDVIRPGQEVALPTSAGSPSAPVASTFEGRTYPAPVTASATANRDALAARGAPTREEVRELLTATAREMGVDPGLVLAIAHQESGFNARAVSPANAVGAMQVIPSSGRWASQLVGRELDLLDPADNAVAGVAILRSLLRSADDEATAVAGYYQGLASVRRNGLYDDTRRYAANVQTLAARYR